MAGGNVGAVALGFLFKTEAIDWHAALFIAGAAVTCISFVSFAIAAEPAAESPAVLPGVTPELAAAV